MNIHYTDIHDNTIKDNKDDDNFTIFYIIKNKKFINIEWFKHINELLIIKEWYNMMDIDIEIKNNIHITRRYFGSAGIDAIYLATGSIDLLICRGIPWWDIAAGMLIIQESGGLICLYDKSKGNNNYGTLQAGHNLFLS